MKIELYLCILLKLIKKMSKKIHIGRLIRQKMREEGRKTHWLAEKIGCDVSNIYRIYGQQFPNSIRVIQICIILEFDVFPHYSEYVRQQIQIKQQDKLGL